MKGHQDRLPLFTMMKIVTQKMLAAQGLADIALFG
jgi:hypothetical protein